MRHQITIALSVLVLAPSSSGSSTVRDLDIESHIPLWHNNLCFVSQQSGRSICYPAYSQCDDSCTQGKVRPPHVPHSTIRSHLYSTHNRHTNFKMFELIEYECRPRYVMVDEADTLFCTRGRWYGTLPVCVPDSRVFGPLLTVKPVSQLSVYPGQNVSFECVALANPPVHNHTWMIISLLHPEQSVEFNEPIKSHLQSRTRLHMYNVRADTRVYCVATSSNNRIYNLVDVLIKAPAPPPAPINFKIDNGTYQITWDLEFPPKRHTHFMFYYKRADFPLWQKYMTEEPTARVPHIRPGKDYYFYVTAFDEYGSTRAKLLNRFNTSALESTSDSSNDIDKENEGSTNEDKNEDSTKEHTGENETEEPTEENSETTPLSPEYIEDWESGTRPEQPLYFESPPSKRIGHPDELRVQITATSMKVTWRPPLYGSEAVEYYRADIGRMAEDKRYVRFFKRVEVTSTMHTFTDLEADQEYFIRVCAIDDNRHRSNYSRITSFTNRLDYQPPTIVSLIAVDAKQSAADKFEIAPATNITSECIAESNQKSKIWWYINGDLSFVDKGLISQPNSTWSSHFNISWVYADTNVSCAAANHIGRSKPQHITVLVMGPGFPPERFASNDSPNGRHQLTWTQPSITNGEITHYELFLSEDDSAELVHWQKRRVNGTAIELTDLIDNKLYFAKMRAVNARGSGPMSRVIEIDTTVANVPAKLVDWSPKVSEDLLSISEGEPVQLTCEMSGVPPPTIRWWIDFEEVNESSDLVQSITIDSIDSKTIRSQIELLPTNNLEVECTADQEDDGPYMYWAVELEHTAY